MKTHCPQGHDLSEHGRQRADRKWEVVCRACERKRDKVRYRRKVLG